MIIDMALNALNIFAQLPPHNIIAAAPLAAVAVGVGYWVEVLECVYDIV